MERNELPPFIALLLAPLAALQASDEEKPKLFAPGPSR